MKKELFIETDIELDLDGHVYECHVIAEGTWFFQEGCLYLRNGDPGYPDESEFDFNIKELDAVTFDDDENEIEVDDKSTLEMIENEVWEHLNNTDLSDWKEC